MPAYRLQQNDLRIVSLREREELLEQLGRKIDSCTEVKSTFRNKAKKFLADVGIWSIAEIDYQVRVEYEIYLKKEISPQATRQYVRGFDQIKRHFVREQMRTLKGQRDALMGLENQIIFLPYHPEQEIADQFERFVSVECLVWDFRKEAPKVLKKQIFDVLHYMLRQHMSTMDRSKRLAALKRFYEFCVYKQVPDIEYLEQKQIDDFKASIPQGRDLEYAMYILDQSRKIIFLEADEINWNANIWYLERFHFEKTRTNPTNPVKTISFIEIEDKENRKYMQQYMKYCLGVTHLTLGVLQREFTQVRNFMAWIEKEEPQNICCVTEDIMKRYFRHIDKSDIKEGSYNQIVISILHFFDYLKVRGFIRKVPFCEQYYLKKVVLKHHDRSVGDDVYAEILGKLRLFPEDLRLMFLHLWGIGLRASEVCSLKGDAYYIQGRDAWIQIYQIKIQNYKRIPIPWALYKLMDVYLKKNKIGPDEYIFQNKKGGAYCYTTFRARMLKYCGENNIAGGEYLFKSHDYRHTVATMYYDNGVSIQSVRDYLGHDYEEMTRQYIDYMPKKISKANEEYFSQKENSLAAGIKRCKRGK